MKATRVFSWLCFGLLSLQAICAQKAAIAPVTPAEVQRKIELMIRLEFQVPTACNVKLGARTPSPFTGYDKLRVTLSQGGRSTAIEFLISKDNKTLARMESFDLDKNPGLSIDVHGRPIRGNQNAPVTVINFDDLECPVCARMHQILKSEVTQEYGDKVRLIYKDNPLTEIHPWAMHAAVDAGCLAQQDASAYWSFVDYVHTHGQEVSGESRDLGASFLALDRIASESVQDHHIDKPVLMACLKKQDETPVRQSMKDARSLGLNFTPALLVNGELARGLTTLYDPKLAIDRALQAEGAK